MAVTPNYGWPVPVATDYVKDGWEAISDLGNAIDTTVAGLGSGLKLISVQNPSASTGVSFTNVLNSTYTHYRLVSSLISSVDGTNMQFRTRVNTTDVTTGYYSATYRWGYDSSANFGASNNNSTASTLTVLTNIANYYDVTAIDFRTIGNFLMFGGSGFYSYFLGPKVLGGACLGATNPITGFTIYPSSGTFTGTIALYGYQKAL